MVNEIGGIGEGIDTGQPREDVNKVSEQAVKKAQSDAKHAKQVQQEIKQSKQENNNLANFLGFLLQDIKDDDLIAILYNTFFKVYHAKKGVTYLRKNINTIVVVGFFAPFYWDKIQEYDLEKYYSDIYNTKELLNVHKYIAFIKKLSHKHHDNIPLNIDNLIELLARIIIVFDLNQHHSLANKTTEDLRVFFRKELGIG